MGGCVCYDEKNAGNAQAVFTRYDEICAKLKQLYTEQKIGGYSAMLFMDESQALDDPAIALGYCPMPLIEHKYPFSFFNISGPDDAFINTFVDNQQLAVLVMVTDYGQSAVYARYKAHDEFIQDVKDGHIPSVQAFLAQNLGIEYRDVEGKTAYDYANDDIKALLNEYRRTHPPVHRCERCNKLYLKTAPIAGKGNQCSSCIGESFKGVYDAARELK